ncbi:MAG: glycosyltransferase family 2 protein [Candidatus Hydrogenedentota bacterium]
MISVVMPAYNEVNTIDQAINAFAHHEEIGEIIVVDGLSEDGTYELLQHLDKNIAKLRVIQEVSRQGKGNAVSLGVNEARGDVIIIQDADNEISAEDVATVANAVTDENPVVFGSRFILDQECAYPSMTLANKLFTRLFNLRNGTRLTDVLTGCKAAKASLWKEIDLKAKGYEIEIEVAEQLARRSHIIEKPVVFKPRKNEEGKKIRLKHAFIILKRMWLG